MYATLAAISNVNAQYLNAFGNSAKEIIEYIQVNYHLKSE